jgi:hypothetical protein
MKLVNSNTGEVIADPVVIADSFFTRFAGLMGKRSMEAGPGLILRPCRSVHTFFMKFAIDVIFLGPRGEVVHLIRDIPPARISPYVRGACEVVELPGGTVKGRVALGDILKIAG